MRPYIPIVLILLLGGCAELAAGAITDATYLRDSARGLVREVHDERRWVRQMCRDIRRAQIMDLQAKGEHDKALDAAAAMYPPLVTFSAVRAFQDDNEDPFGSLNDPWPCRRNAPAPLPETTISPPVDLLGPSEHIEPMEIPTLNPQTGLLGFANQ